MVPGRGLVRLAQPPRLEPHPGDARGDLPPSPRLVVRALRSPDPERDAFYEVKTWWRSFDDFVAWTKSESFREAHSSRPPKEMFAGKNVLEIHEVFLSTDEQGG